jgi:hypothetical protein
MNPTREEARFALVLEKAADKRPAFLDAMCEEDPALRRRGSEFDGRSLHATINTGRADAPR